MARPARAPNVPDGWFHIFSWQSQPARVPAESWPPLADVMAALRQQHRRLRQAIAELTKEQLDGPISPGSSLTVRYRIFHALHDEACHTGEIWLQRKMLQAGTLSPQE